MSLVYNFAFAPPAAGETVTITDDSGTEIDTAEVGSTVGIDGAVVAQASLPEGAYIGTVEGTFGTWSVRGFLNVPDSIEDQPGAAETAYFVATGPVMDSSGGGTVIEFEADPAHGDLPSWATLVDGKPTLGADAGTCGFAVDFAYDFDFSDATGSAGVSGTLNNYTTFELDGTDIFGAALQANTDGDGTDTQATDALLRGGVLVGTTLVVTGYPTADEDGSTPIEDAVVTPDFGLTITRLTPRPVRPSQA